MPDNLQTFYNSMSWAVLQPEVQVMKPNWDCSGTSGSNSSLPVLLQEERVLLSDLY
jgi:hypothetical protein